MNKKILGKTLAILLVLLTIIAIFSACNGSDVATETTTEEVETFETNNLILAACLRAVANDEVFTEEDFTLVTDFMRTVEPYQDLSMLENDSQYYYKWNLEQEFYLYMKNSHGRYFFLMKGNEEVGEFPCDTLFEETEESDGASWYIDNRGLIRACLGEERVFEVPYESNGKVVRSYDEDKILIEKGTFLTIFNTKTKEIEVVLKDAYTWDYRSFQVQEGDSRQILFKTIDNVLHMLNLDTFETKQIVENVDYFEGPIGMLYEDGSYIVYLTNDHVLYQIDLITSDIIQIAEKVETFYCTEGFYYSLLGSKEYIPFEIS